MEKWEMTDTSSFLRQLAAFFSSGVQDKRVFLTALETSWIALNRMQSLIDVTIPWNTLDQYRREVQLNLPARTFPS
jgi:hypothetical protein